MCFCGEGAQGKLSWVLHRIYCGWCVVVLQHCNHVKVNIWNTFFPFWDLYLKQRICFNQWIWPVKYFKHVDTQGKIQRIWDWLNNIGTVKRIKHHLYNTTSWHQGENIIHIHFPGCPGSPPKFKFHIQTLNVMYPVGY